MHQTKADFLVQKYRQILRASLLVEAVSYIMTMTDTLIAGNMIGEDALAAAGLVAPLLTVTTFIASVINSGTLLNYSYCIGRFEERRAHEYFSQGVLLALSMGALSVVLMYVCAGVYFSNLKAYPELAQAVHDYYSIILLFGALAPISALLDNAVVSDGGEKLSAFSNITQIVLNVVLSVLFSRWWGIRGIAIATVGCKALFVLLISTWFFGKKNTLRFVWWWKWQDCFAIFRRGVVRASAFCMTALMEMAVYRFTIAHFAGDTVVVLTVAEKILEMYTLFLGLSMASQPLVVTLRGERNTKALRFLMHAVTGDMLVMGLLLSVLTVLSARGLVFCFGVRDAAVVGPASAAVRYVGTTLVVQALMTLFFIYYYLSDRHLLALSISVLTYFLCPFGLAAAISLVLGSPEGMWIGFMLSPVAAAALSALLVLLQRKGTSFPYLLPTDRDDRIFIYDFPLSEENAVMLSRTVGDELDAHGVPRKTRNLVRVLAEDLLVLITGRNADAKGVPAEVNMMLEEDGVRMILRDAGVAIDMTDTDPHADSLRQFLVANIMLTYERKMYLLTNGYNRSEFFISNRTA